MPNNEPVSRPHPVLIAALGFVAGALAASAWFFENRLEPIETVNPDIGAAAATSSAATSTSAGENIITVHDQAAGPIATIDSVNVPAPGVWVAVAEISNGALGNVLGAAWVPGPSTDVAVHLLRDTAPGSTYAVVLYRDNGDGVFDLHDDSIYVDFATGERVVALFRTSL